MSARYAVPYAVRGAQAGWLFLVADDVEHAAQRAATLLDGRTAAPTPDFPAPDRPIPPAALTPAQRTAARRGEPVAWEQPADLWPAAPESRVDPYPAVRKPLTKAERADVALGDPFPTSADPVAARERRGRAWAIRAELPGILRRDWSLASPELREKRRQQGEADAARLEAEADELDAGWSLLW